MPRLVAVATALPEHRCAQERASALCRDWLRAGRPWSGDSFGRSGVRTRYFVEPPERQFPARPFARRNALWSRHALELAAEACARCLDRAGVKASEAHSLFGVTTTGLRTPSLEARLAAALGFSPRLRRTPIFGAGCAGGVVALARAAEHLRGHPRELAIALSVEICSLTFRPDDDSPAQRIAAGLFGDGAAAALLAGDEAAPGLGGAEWLGGGSRLLPGSERLMGWDFDGGGMRLILGAGVPRAVERFLGGEVDELLAREAPGERVAQFALHPGSLRVIEACERALGVGAEATRLSREFLSAHGNLSSASVLFILERALADPAPPGALLLAAAMGPGFSIETALFRRP